MLLECVVPGRGEPCVNPAAVGRVFVRVISPASSSGPSRADNTPRVKPSMSATIR